MNKIYETPIKAIRKKCIDCCDGQLKEVRLCRVVKCAIYPYRFGKRPNESTIDTIYYYLKKNP